MGGAGCEGGGVSYVRHAWQVQEGGHGWETLCLTIFKLVNNDGAEMDGNRDGALVFWNTHGDSGTRSWYQR